MMLRIAGALTEVALGLVLAVLAARGRGVRHRIAPRRAQAVALTAGGVALAVWGLGEALRGSVGGALQLAGLALLVAAAVVLVAGTPADPG